MHFISCPICNSVREVSNGVACQVRKGIKRGLCPPCAINFRKTNRNSGQFRPGIVPKNKLSPEERLLQKERRRMYKLQWRENNRPHVTAYFKNYYRANIEAGRKRGLAARAKRRASGYINTKIVNALIESHTINGVITCYICCTEAKIYEIDHIIPVSLGGTNDVSNLAIACRRCNRRKTNKPLEVFLSDVSKEHSQPPKRL